MHASCVAHLPTNCHLLMLLYDTQELALKVKAQGGVYKPQKYKRKVYKEHVGEGVGANRAKKDKDRKKQRDTPSWRPYDKVDVSARVL